MRDGRWHELLARTTIRRWAAASGSSAAASGLCQCSDLKTGLANPPTQVLPSGARATPGAI